MFPEKGSLSPEVGSILRCSPGGVQKAFHILMSHVIHFPIGILHLHSISACPAAPSGLGRLHSCLFSDQTNRCPNGKEPTCNCERCNWEETQREQFDRAWKFAGTIYTWMCLYVQIQYIYIHHIYICHIHKYVCMHACVLYIYYKKKKNPREWNV